MNSCAGIVKMPGSLAHSQSSRDKQAPEFTWCADVGTRETLGKEYDEKIKGRMDDFAQGVQNDDRRPRMRIAVFLESVPDSGGGFQQALSVVKSLTVAGSTKDDFVVFTPFEKTRQRLLREGVDAKRFKHHGLSMIDKWSSTVVGNAVLRRLRRFGLNRFGRYLDALLEDHGIDLVVLNECGDVAQRIGDHPMIVTVRDLDHRDHPEFPEAYVDRAFERRERALGITLTRAVAVIASSPSSARRIASLYQVDPTRIIHFPLVPSLAVRRHAGGRRLSTAEGVRHKYNLPARYVFYPAFFFPLENHLYLLEGLVALERQHGIILDAVFCGGGSAAHRAVVKRQTQALGLTARVHFLGSVPDEDVPALYQDALALVMPTYAARPSLPPLEAVTLGCPVIYSDLPQCREQMGNAALYCDLADVSSLANQLATLTQDPATKNKLSNAGRRRAAELAEINYGERLAPVLDDYAHHSRLWSWPA